MPIVEPVIRPPSEAGSFLLQITTACSSNHCSFCGAYLNKPFSLKPMDEIQMDIAVQKQIDDSVNKVFLMDGDSLCFPHEKLEKVLGQLNQAFSQLRRISSYSNDYSILSRSREQLESLRRQRLSLVYMGLESGDQRVLDSCRKKSSVAGMIEAVKKLKLCGIKSSIMVLLGLGGRENSRGHALATARALNEMQPDMLSFLTVMLVPGTALYEQAQKGEFEPLNSHEILEEMNLMIQGLELKNTLFFSNHASNFLPLQGRFPGAKAQFLKVLEKAQSGELGLRSEWMRGL